jgi:hypothetical protein
LDDLLQLSGTVVQRLPGLRLNGLWECGYRVVELLHRCRHSLLRGRNRLGNWLFDLLGYVHPVDGAADRDESSYHDGRRI